MYSIYVLLTANSSAQVGEFVCTKGNQQAGADAQAPWRRLGPAPLDGPSAP